MPDNTRPDMTPEALTPLLEWASPRESEAIAHLNAGTPFEDTAAAMGVQPTSVLNMLSKLRRRAASRGHAPAHDMVHTTAPGFSVKGTSTFYDDEGRVSRQWVKTERDKEAQFEAMRDAIEALCEPVRGLADPVPRPAADDSDLMVLVPWGDPHVGMLAHREECGANFDVKIAEAQLVEATERLVGLAPSADRFVLVSIGDFFHADDSTSRTPASKHVLDTDSRFPEVAAVGIRIVRRCIDLALAKFGRVEFVPVLGNHDPHASMWLGLAVSCLYEREPRVTVLDTRAKINYLEHGKCLIALSHGDTIKMKDVPEITAADVPEIWGRTIYRHAYLGHVHHDSSKEGRGMSTESIRTLSPKDRYASHHGYRSGQDVKCDVWHKDHGMILRHRVGVAQLGGGR